MSRQLYFGLISLVVLVTTYVQAQSGIEYSTGNNVRIYAPTFAQYNGIEGSPYVPDDSIKNGWLIIGTKRIPTKLRYNSYTGVVEYMQGSQLLTPSLAINEFVILAPDTLHFYRGFPAVDAHSAADYYQLLFDGRKTKLLKYTSATIKSNTDAMHEDFGKKTFQNRDAYYVWVVKKLPVEEYTPSILAEGEMKAVALNKKALVSLLPQYTTRIDQYLADQKIKLRTWAEFAGVLRYLESQ